MATILSATPGLLKIANLAGARGFLAQLAPLNSAQRQAQLLTQLKLLADARVTGDMRLQVLEAVRSAILESQHARSRDYWGKPVPFDDDTREIFERTVAIWRALADAYESLITDMAEAAPDLAEHAEVICYRALRCTGFAMSAHNRAYYEIPGVLWEQLHRLYAFSESAGVTDMPVPEGSGNSTVALSYLQTVLAQRAQPDALSLLQMNTVDRALAQWVGLGRISVAQPGVADDTEFALGVDLDSCAGAQQLMQYTGGNLRRLHLEKIGDQLRKTAIALKTQRPDQLGLGSIAAAACEQLLQRLHAHWFTPGAARMDERKPVSFNVLVSNTLAAMHYNISGKPFAPPDAGLSSRARFEMAGFERVDGPAIGEVSARSRILETWEVANQSSSGILGVCRKPTDTTQLTHNQMLGLVAPNGNTYVGMVQRLSVDAQGAAWLGFRVLPLKVQPVAARIADINVPYDRALLLPASAEGEPPTIVVHPGTYASGRILDVHDGGDRPRQIRLIALYDSGSNFERATYTAV